MIKLPLLIFTILTCHFCFSQSFNATYTFDNVTDNLGGTTSSGSTDPTPVPTVGGIQFGSFHVVESPLVHDNPVGDGRFAFSGWPVDAGGANTQGDYTLHSGTIDLTHYYEVTITPNTNYVIDLNKITFTVHRSGSMNGIRTYAVRSSLDLNNNLPASISPTNSNLSIKHSPQSNIFYWVNDASGPEAGSTITLGNDYDAISSAITFRFYGWNAEALTGIFGIDNVSFEGNVYNILPVDLLYFKGECNNNQSVLVEWAAASKRAHEYFVIEHSNDGMNYFPLDTIYDNSAMASATEYKFCHVQFVNGRNYYRLIETDQDGRSGYLDVISVGCENNITDVYPNPSHGDFTIDSKIQSEIFITNPLGKIVFSTTLKAGRTAFNLNDSMKGIYHVIFSSKVQRITKNILIE